MLLRLLSFAPCLLLVPMAAHASSPVGNAVFYATDYGVKCDDATDDTSALQTAINAAQAPTASSTGGILQLPAGFCRLTGALTISGPVTVLGAGAGVQPVVGDSGGTVIRSDCASCNHFTVTSVAPFSLRNVTLDKSVTATGGAGVSIVQSGTNINRQSQFENVAMLGLAYGYYFVNTANWSIDNPYILDFRVDGIYLASTNTSPDLGDSSIKGGTIWDFNYTAGDADIRLDPAAGIEIVGVKLLGGNFGVHLTVSQGPTGTLNIGQDSFEQHNVSEIYVEQTVPGKTYAFITVTGNEFQTYNISSYQNAITLANSTSQYLSGVAITGNVFKACTSLYGVIDLQSVNGAAVTGNVVNVCNAAPSSAIVLGANALNTGLSNNIVYNGPS